MRETGLDPSRLEFEITESVLMEQTDAAIFQLDALRELGVRIVMDDFGTGYSSLSYLQRFRFDKIKLDRSFVSGIEHDCQSAAIVSTVLQLGRTLGIQTLAEGVETERQVTLLAAEGCNQLQGFLFSPAVPQHAIGELLAEAAPLAPVGAEGAGDPLPG